MKAIDITFTDELAETIARNALEHGLQESEYLTKIIEQHIANPARRALREWMPIERWKALVRGEQCSICRDVQENQDLTEEMTRFLLLALVNCGL